MKQWEDIVKDKLEGYESALPEGSLAAFRARASVMAGQSGHLPARRSPLLWLAAAAVACLAAIFFLLRQAPEADSPLVAQVVETPKEIVTQPQEPVRVVETPRPAEKTKPASVVETVEPTETIEIVEPAETVEEVETVEPVETVETVETVELAETVEFADTEVVTRTANSSGSYIAGGVAGGGLAAVYALAKGVSHFTPAAGKSDYQYDPGHVTDHGNSSVIPDNLLSQKHSMPFKAGLSVRIKLNDRLGITTGLEYSLYTSRFKYRNSGTMTQKAQYLGVPLRLDWTFASARCFDFYVGGGLQGDFCVGAKLGGKSIAKDGFSFSMLGVGGVQLNISKRIGIYMEPEFSWTKTAGRVLDTYRSKHPFMFSATAGLRLNL